MSFSSTITSTAAAAAYAAAATDALRNQLRTFDSAKLLSDQAWAYRDMMIELIVESGHFPTINNNETADWYLREWLVEFCLRFFHEFGLRVLPIHVTADMLHYLSWAELLQPYISLGVVPQSSVEELFGFAMEEFERARRGRTPVEVYPDVLQPFRGPLFLGEPEVPTRGDEDVDMEDGEVVGLQQPSRLLLAPEYLVLWVTEVFAPVARAVGIYGWWVYVSRGYG